MPRFAPAITTTTVSKAYYIWTGLILQSMMKLSESGEFEWSELATTDEELIVKYSIGYSVFSKLNKDLAKVNFSTENLYVTPKNFAGQEIENWLGPQTIGNLTFIGGYAGGDWEQPVAFAIYDDGKTWRGYVPKDGNSYNHATNCAYGAEEKKIIPDVAKMKADISNRIIVR